MGVETSLSTPGFPAAPAASEAGFVQYADGSSAYLTVGPRTPWPTERWIADASVSLDRQEPRATPGLVFDRRSAFALAGWRLPESRASTYLLAGPEIERADVATLGGMPVLGPSHVRRSYAGLALGARRATLRFDTTSWLLGNDAVVDVPRGTEGDVVMSVGHDAVSGHAATHLDGWIGHTLVSPSASTVAVADLWASAYTGDEQIASSTLRGQLTVLRRAPRGRWTLRLAAERLENPDPDVRALSLVDPLRPALPAPCRLAVAAVAASLERDVHVVSIGRLLSVDGAGFVAASARWDATSPMHDDVGLGVVGAGLRFVPARAARASLRVDVGLPVVERGLGRRPYVGLSVTPWLFADRTRDGRRLP
jgi:hypothetical protein